MHVCIAFLVSVGFFPTALTISNSAASFVVVFAAAEVALVWRCNCIASTAFRTLPLLFKIQPVAASNRRKNCFVKMSKSFLCHAGKLWKKKQRKQKRCKRQQKIIKQAKWFFSAPQICWHRTENARVLNCHRRVAYAMQTLQLAIVVDWNYCCCMQRGYLSAFGVFQPLFQCCFLLLLLLLLFNVHFLLAISK